MTKHALERAQERYGVALTDDDLRAIRALINDGKARCLTKRNRHGQHYVVRYEGRYYRLCYCMETGAIMAFLPPDERTRGKVRGKARGPRRVFRGGTYHYVLPG